MLLGFFGACAVRAAFWTVGLAGRVERDMSGWLASSFRLDARRSLLGAASAASHFALAVPSRLESLAVTRCDSFSTCTLSAFTKGDCLLVILQRPFRSLRMLCHPVAHLYRIALSCPALLY